VWRGERASTLEEVADDRPQDIALSKGSGLN
jgi:hypothetical protein